MLDALLYLVACSFSGQSQTRFFTLEASCIYSHIEQMSNRKKKPPEKAGATDHSPLPTFD